LASQTITKHLLILKPTTPNANCQQSLEKWGREAQAGENHEYAREN